MQDILTMLNTLHRPRLMMRAARIGAQDYRRAAHLPRLLGYGVLPRHGAALLKLMDIEAALEEQRTQSDASYSLIRHLDVLIAMVAEARILRRAQAPAQPQAPAVLGVVT
ncbi:DUF6477 family protein [Sulfitobacter geojensis]|jgi:hypothetical protein|uniref:Uncharacterized protein n=1 Tax=Sulfitobacter geojensis TaxID=1342299 RepID=A0AAE2VVX4_9RHOB|nr:DUF6477 family protein [Sulfitobacter geojensis]KHA52270.1 hypothetical protein Z947_2572 [Sulfitobacter geojensis]MBM1688360.1 hypothetical protein [Sulfitobacter geojensis]MBM1692427.1 hypothetical protein [Sulfitobacter geojensis]MBM1704593.1 hypothetical protein [Sulfitobacter geojensis]MBM1708651.1 hypothetical protein [Sulfitobacter geojensis]